MKIAILYSGLPFFDLSFYENHKKYIYDYYNYDIFISTYDTNLEYLNQIEEIYKPKKLQVEGYGRVEEYLKDIERLVINKRPETKIINTLSMHYKNFRAFSLIDQPDQYDIIIRNRLDIKFDTSLLLDLNNKINIPKGGDHYGGLMDLFAYGNSIIMSQYCSAFLFLPTYFIKYNIIFHPEILLRNHCVYNNILINRFDYNVYLRDNLFTNTAPTYY